MKIAIDALPLMMPKTGIGFYTHHLLSEFIQIAPENDYYCLAEVFVFPSFYEGFGLPVLEAMACGTPVVTSNVSSLPEVGSDAVIYTNPRSVDELANGIRRILSDKELRSRCITKGLERAKVFSWGKCAMETLKVLNEANQT